ncbi:NAD-dependent epimerase/dehydratase family protein [Vibrio kanaloae]|uniref:NAD-dependent epimerase/dehydratase family protein n=1 Tax=Vibrio kanaloae TaxID=170673 RepID=UPI0011B36FEB|nr:NAD-dependent epimerase/dehydratase family protein [Vibrio kanaloae]NOI03336.1 NAD-dependent epimerase/dehydratase family protein [Vibrio kanaloae]
MVYKKCLVLGANGFVGRSLVKDLIPYFEQVTTFSLDLSKEIQLEGVENIVADFFDKEALQKALVDVDVVIHLITTMTPISSNQAPLQDIEQNLSGSVRLLELCCAEGVKKVIYLSSGGTVYGDLSTVERADETHVTDPSCSYGITKLAFEKYLNLFKRLYDLDSIVLRVSNPYGPLQSCKNSQGVIASFIDKSVNNAPLQVWGDGTAIRDFIYIDDLNSAIIKSVFYKGEKRVFNIGSGADTSINDVIDCLRKTSQSKIYVDYLKEGKVGVSRSVLDISLAKRELDWEPMFDLNRGLRNTVDYIDKA